MNSNSHPKVTNQLYDRLIEAWESFISRQRSKRIRYFGSIAIVVAAAVLTRFLPFNERVEMAFINFCAAILAALYGGIGPGLVAGAISWLIVDYYYILPFGSVLESFRTILFMTYYLLLTFLMSLLVSSLRAAYQKGQRATAEALRAMKSRENILAVVSHDMRNPLSAISLNSQLLAKSLESGKKELAIRQLEMINVASQQLSRLIQDLIDAARIDASNFSVRPEPGDLRRVIEQALALIRPRAAAHGIEIRFHADETVPRALIDGQRTLQVLANLLDNAIKFTPRRGQIWVSLHSRPAAKRIEVSVRDSGKGIAPNDLPHLFERSWQARGSAHLGAGLGLYIAQGIIRAQGGEISASSSLGKGSTFTFTVPVLQTNPSGQGPRRDLDHASQA